MATLKKYAQAVGCRLEIKLVPDARPVKRANKAFRSPSANRQQVNIAWYGKEEYAHAATWPKTISRLETGQATSLA